MKRAVRIAGSIGLVTTVSTFGLACSSARKLEACRFVEIEPAEINSLQETVSEGAIREGWELEALCGDLLIDFKGSWLQNQLGVNIRNAYNETDPTKGASSLAQNGLLIRIDESTGKRNPDIWASSRSVDDEIQAKKGDAWNFDK